MLLNIFLGLIAMLTLVFGDCDFGSQGTDNYDYPKVSICVLKRFLKQVTLKIFLCLQFFVSINQTPTDNITFICSSN